jgi:hypothetical protein
MATRRATVADNAPDVFGFINDGHISPKAWHAAVRRFAIGHLALAIEELTGADNYDIVSALAVGLFPGDVIGDKILKKYRATAEKSPRAIRDLGLPPDLLNEV